MKVAVTIARRKKQVMKDVDHVSEVSHNVPSMKLKLEKLAA